VELSKTWVYPSPCEILRSPVPAAAQSSQESKHSALDFVICFKCLFMEAVLNG
jgi:hypothetical protein